MVLYSDPDGTQDMDNSPIVVEFSAHMLQAREDGPLRRCQIESHHNLHITSMMAFPNVK